jgi:hypothetical protein
MVLLRKMKQAVPLLTAHLKAKVLSTVVTQARKLTSSDASTGQQRIIIAQSTTGSF